MTSRIWWRNMVIGLATVGPVLIGFVSAILAIFLILGGNYTPAALSLIAAGITFGLLAIAVFGSTS